MPDTPTLSRPFGALGLIAGLALAGPAHALVPGAANGLPCGGTVLIEAGDTLDDAAAYCGVSADAILAVNPAISDPDRLAAGISLVIPGAVPAPATDFAAMEELVAPIALYPDALLAEMLTAATYPLEIVQAHRWAQANGPDADPSGEEWAPSVQALARYPDVLAMMSSDLDWSIRLGDAFLADPDGVFDAIQGMRARAQAAGNLNDNDQQQVIVEAAPEAPVAQTVETYTEIVEPVVETRTIIRIVPRYETVFVPTYHPRWVYFPRRYYADFYYDPVITFGAGYALGSWLTHYVDWRYRYVRLTPFDYRYPRFFYGPRLHYGFNTRVWTPWVHHPIHRRGYRYIDVPRVRVNEGQRHLVNVVPRSRAGRVGARGRAIAGRDYRQAERASALTRTRAGNVRPTAGARNADAGSTRSITARLGNNGRRADNRAVTTARRSLAANDARARRDQSPVRTETRGTRGARNGGYGTGARSTYTGRHRQPRANDEHAARSGQCGQSPAVPAPYRTGAGTRSAGLRCRQRPRQRRARTQYVALDAPVRADQPGYAPQRHDRPWWRRTESRRTKPVDVPLPAAVDRTPECTVAL